MKEWELMLKMVKVGFALNAGIVFMFSQIITDIMEEIYIFVKVSDELIVYAVWYEKYQCYIAIRKLTPKECFRLQGWSDNYFGKAQFVNSDSQLYKQAGNGVTVTVIEAIARKMKVESVKLRR